MAVVTTFSHQFLMEVMKKEHDVSTDALKVALMDTTFAFDPDTHATWADCSANEITGGNGYTAGGETLLNVAVSIDATADQVDIAADNMTWTASGGPIAETGAAVVYNSTHASNTVVMCIDFGADYITADGRLFQLNFENGFAVVDNA